MMLPIVIASDHAGYSLKEQVKKHLEEKSIEYIDLGTNSTESVAYPEYASKLCKAIQEGKANMGILVCGTGIGMSMAANKHKGIRAACVSDTFSAKATRMHNDANVLCFGERVVGAGLAFELVDAFLSTEYEGGRHQARVDMVNSFDK
ncbi:MAG: ribose 5-phosphate isomerase B [Ruminococcaceae bacterium]|nr:ribose 5-phosphate isomerase B [Oscillospiraceae bacterium]